MIQNILLEFEFSNLFVIGLFTIIMGIAMGAFFLTPSYTKNSWSRDVRSAHRISLISMIITIIFCMIGIVTSSYLPDLRVQRIQVQDNSGDESEFIVVRDSSDNLISIKQISSK